MCMIALKLMVHHRLILIVVMHHWCYNPNKPNSTAVQTFSNTCMITTKFSTGTRDKCIQLLWLWCMHVVITAEEEEQQHCKQGFFRTLVLLCIHTQDWDLYVLYPSHPVGASFFLEEWVYKGKVTILINLVFWHYTSI